MRLAAPSSLAFVIQAGVSLTEVWFVGQLGTTALATIALVFPLSMLMLTLSGGAMGGAVSSAIARAVGAGDIPRAETLIWHALALALAFAGVLLLVFLLGGEAFLTFLGGKDEVLASALAYGGYLFAGGFFIWLVGTLTAVSRGLGNMVWPAQVMALNALIQIPLSGALVLGWGGLPQMGAPGAALSAIIAAAVSCSVLLYRLTTTTQPVRLRLSRWSLSAALVRDILQVFLPASLSPLLTVTTILCLTAIVATFGEAALAGYGIGSRIEFLVIPLVFGLGTAMTSLVGMSTGAGMIERAVQVGWTGGISAAVIAGGIGALLALFPGVWIPLFSESPQVQASATEYIQIVGPGYAFFGLGLSLYFASQGALAMSWPVVATVIRVLVGVGGALALGYGLDMGLSGVYIAALASLVAYGFIIAASVRMGAWGKSKPA